MGLFKVVDASIAAAQTQVRIAVVALWNLAWKSRPTLLSSMKGVKNADENELQEIASEPDSTHAYNVAEFDLMHTVVESLTRTVCSRVEEQHREIKGTRG